jgi:hypothetical protein
MKRRHFLRVGIALAAASGHGVPSAGAARTSYVRPRHTRMAHRR